MGKIAEKCSREIRKSMEAGEVDHHDDAEAYQPGFVNFFPRRDCRRDKHHAKEDADED